MDDFYEGFAKAFNDDPFFDAISSSPDNSSSQDDEEGFFAVMIGAAHVVGIVLLIFGVRRWCCRKEATPNLDGEELVADIEHLQPKKRVVTGYMLFFCGGGFGFLGFHHFYLERLVHGFLAFYTLNFCFVGCFLDLILLPWYVKWFNNQRTAPNAPYDNSPRSLFWRLPLLSISIAAMILLFAVKTPWLLHKTGIVDIDRLAAQTSANPYDILEIPRDADWETANKAYKKLSRSWHPDRCKTDKEVCTGKFAELGKAHDLIKTRKAPIHRVLTWRQWIEEEVLRDWVHVFEVLKGSPENDPPPKPKKRKEKEKKRHDL
mmetsp:Transcript_94356/g.149212  ORF Transcript_94356/g.149212 Transcript_94356/m.149212 type:complete len:318 (-) Transcript_94356:5-958(-)